MEPITVSVREATKLTGLGRSTLYKLMAEGRLQSTTVYSSRLIYVSSLYLLMGLENPIQNGHKSETVISSAIPISEKLNPIPIPDSQKLSVPITLPTTISSDAGGQSRTDTVNKIKKRPKIKGNPERARRLRTFANGR